MQYDPEFTEVAERITQRLAPHLDHPIVTHGMVVVEFLVADSEHRGVLGVSLGRQGPMQPYQVVGILTPVMMGAQKAIAHQLDQGKGP